MIIVRRYHLALTHAYGIGTQACMDEAEDGFYVQHSEHLAEVRQTQRRMIAALYWRAGWARDAAEREHPSSQHRTALMRRYLSAREMAADLAIAMEAACAR